jgi:hypothetical protein
MFTYEEHPRSDRPETLGLAGHFERAKQGDEAVLLLLSEWGARVEGSITWLTPVLA